MKIFKVTEEDMKRHDILHQVKNKQLTFKQASMILNVGYRQTLRLFRQFDNSGLHGIVKKYNNSGKNLKLNDTLSKKIIKLYEDIYFDFNILHFKEKLQENHNIILSYESIRQLLSKNGKHLPKKRRKIYRRRRRMPKAGLLVQMDSSQHHWLAHMKEKWWLIASIDDASNEVPAAFFTPSDTTYANMQNIRQITANKGLFEALYVDKASHFKTTRHEGLHQNVNNEQEQTNIGKALEELGITLILANSPQAKGRIERLFRFFQDRLIKEMRLEGIQDYEQANKFLQEKFLPWYNRRYTRDVESVYTPLPKDKDLDFIFTKREIRKVRKDNTIPFYGEFIQLPPSRATLSYTKPPVEIRCNDQQDLYVVYKDKIILKTKLSQKIKETDLEKREKFLNRRIAS